MKKSIITKNNSIIIDFEEFSKLNFDQQKKELNLYLSNNESNNDIYINFNELLYTDEQLENIFTYIISLNFDKRIILNGIKDENFLFIEYLFNIDKIKKAHS